VIGQLFGRIIEHVLHHVFKILLLYLHLLFPLLFDVPPTAIEFLLGHASLQQGFHIGQLPLHLIFIGCQYPLEIILHVSSIFTLFHLYLFESFQFHLHHLHDLLTLLLHGCSEIVLRDVVVFGFLQF